MKIELSQVFKLSLFTETKNGIVLENTLCFSSQKSNYHYKKIYNKYFMLLTTKFKL